MYPSGYTAERILTSILFTGFSMFTAILASNKNLVCSVSICKFMVSAVNTVSEPATL